MAYDLSIIKECEGFRSHAYPDPLSGGAPWTIGYGSTHHTNGAAVRSGDVVTKEQAEKLLQWYVMTEIVPHLQKIPDWGEMSPCMQVALIDFAYNLGASFYGAEGFGSISRALREKQWNAIPDILPMYCNPGTSCEAGLRRRREEEAGMWASGLAGLAKKKV